MKNEWLETQLPATAVAAAEARGFLRAVLETWALDGLGDVTELLATELVTNALRHAGGPVTLRVAADADRIRVEVDDPVRTEPVKLDLDLDSDGGRGVFLIDALASSW